MRRSDIARRFDEIVAFAEVDQFLDTPVKRYSSGMQVRLGFAVAAHLEPEILVVDDVLAVGDVAFQKKCLAKMEDVSHEGRTILFVSHNMPAVETLCTRGVLLERGELTASGPVGSVIDAYLAAASERRSTALADRNDRLGDGRIRFTGVSADLKTGSDSEVRIAYESKVDALNVQVAIGIRTARGEPAAFLSTDVVGASLGAFPRSGEIVCVLPSTALVPGSYSLNLFCAVGGEVADWVSDAIGVTVEQGDFFGSGKLPPPDYGSVALRQEWSVRPHRS
jgi:lipopolysaccharide transport system ATP-binding protein